MKGRLRLPTYVVAVALLGLIALLATLQYRWLGQISESERERMQANLATRAGGFASDFDREITRAYLTFQLDPVDDEAGLAARLADRYDRWHATSRDPRLVRDVFLILRNAEGSDVLQRYHPASRVVERAAWPLSLEPIRVGLEAPVPAPGRDDQTMVLRRLPRNIWESIPAVVVPAPVVLVASGLRHHGVAYVVLLLDRQFITGEMLPSLAQQHFRSAGEEIEYDLAVVSTAGGDALFSTAVASLRPPDVGGDASADLFQVRPQEFGAMVSEVRRFTAFVSSRSDAGAPGGGPETRRVIVQQTPMQMAGPGRQAQAAIPRWRLVVKHPAGSLEAAVATVRRRNLLVSSGILGVLGISIGFLVVSTRRAQDLARQQMEFVAAVSHELRTPLAVIRSAADNLADGVVHDDPSVRKYGTLVRGEGRRLSEMVEQILELAGIHSGQRGFVLTAVPVAPLLQDVLDASAVLVDQAGITVEVDAPSSLPPVLGDEAALRRVFQNLVSNGIKYGASGGWLSVRARASGREVQVTVADRGIGVAPAEQARIFEPFYRAPEVIAAQIQGAGLGLNLVQRIVSAHGGRVTVESTGDRGSTFTVSLPVASGEPAARAAQAGHQAPGVSPS